MKAKFIPAGSEPSQFILAGIKPIKLALRRGYLVESMPVSQLRIPFLRFHNCNREYYADGRAAGYSLFSFRLGRRHRISLKNVLIYDILAKEKAICDGGEQPCAEGSFCRGMCAADRIKRQGILQERWQRIQKQNFAGALGDGC